MVVPFDFSNYLNVVQISHTLDSDQKHALMLNCIGEDATRIISGLEYDSTDDNPNENLTQALKGYFLPKTNLTFKRYQFLMLKQDDKMLPFLNELHNKGKNVISQTLILIRFIIKIFEINSLLVSNQTIYESAYSQLMI